MDNMLVLKAVVYRVFRILIVLAVSFFVLGNIQTAIGISLIDAIIATVYYYYFDVVWAKFEHLLLHWKYRKFDKGNL